MQIRYLSLAALVVLSACSSDDDDTNTTQDSITTSAETATVSGVTAASSSFLMNYPMPGVDGKQRAENAIVIIPTGETPEGGWPVVGWGHGTVGTADICAPSASGLNIATGAYLNNYVAAGFAVVAPDYEGLGTQGGHPYLHLQSEGRSINYAVSAAVGKFPQLSNRYAAVGHSQGGHAVLGAGANAAENTDITLVGVAAIAPASQIATQGTIFNAVVNDSEGNAQQRLEAAIAQLGFSALILEGVKAVDPTFDLDAAYGDDGDQLQMLASTSCLGEVGQGIFADASRTLLDNGNVDSILPFSSTQLPEVVQYLAAAEPGSSVIDADVLILQGTADTTVLPSSTDTLVSQLSDANTAAPNLVPFEGATHSTVLVDSLENILTFLSSVFTAQN